LRPGGHLIVTTPNGVSYAALERWLRRRSPVSYGSFRNFGASVGAAAGAGGVGGCAPGNCTVGLGHLKEYSTEEIDLAFKSSGLDVVKAATFNPYRHTLAFFSSTFQKDHRIWNQPRRGEVHFVVGKKMGCSPHHPCRQAVGPLYDHTKDLSETHVLWRDNLVHYTASR